MGRGHPAPDPLEDLLSTHDLALVHEKPMYVPDNPDQASEGMGRVNSPKVPAPGPG